MTAQQLAQPTASRVPASTRLATAAGVVLVAVGAIIAAWQASRPAEEPETATALSPYDDGVLGDLQALVPNLAFVLLGVIAVTVVVMYKARPHRL
jgi:hypothetical protein